MRTPSALNLGGASVGLTPVVRVLLWVNGLAYLFLVLIANRPFVLGPYGTTDTPVDFVTAVTMLLGLVPHAVIHQWALWQPLTYLFLHTQFWHLLLNMVAVWLFGIELERTWGSRTFFRYYLFTGVGAALSSLFLSWLLGWNPFTITYGASGSVFGLLIAFGLLFPNRVVYLYFVIPVRVKYFVFLYALLEVLMLGFSTGDGISHIAHVGGMLFGLAWFGVKAKGLSAAGIWRSLQRRRMRRKLRLIRQKQDDKDPPGPYSGHTLH